MLITSIPLTGTGAIVSTSGLDEEVLSDEQEPLAEPPVILNDPSNPSEAQNTTKECENCVLLKVEKRKLRN